jgi:hypothetical protein
MHEGTGPPQKQQGCDVATVRCAGKREARGKRGGPPADVRALMTRLLAHISGDPALHRESAVWVLGDWNFTPYRHSPAGSCSATRESRSG